MQRVNNYLNDTLLNTMKKISSDPISIKVLNKKKASEKRLAIAKSPIPPSPASSDARNFVQEILELTKLFREGHLTKEEFTRAKTKLLQ